MKFIIYFILFFLANFSLAQIVNKSDIQFTYKVENYMVTQEEDVILTCSLNNTSNSNVYFISGSCNDLTYNIVNDNPSITPTAFVHCNGSHPVKKLIEANSTYKFEVIMSRTDGLNINSDDIKPSIELVIVNKAYNLSNESLGDVKSANLNNKQIIFLKGVSN